MGGVPSALIAKRSKVFLKEEAESAIYMCNGTAGASCGASPDHAPDVMKILLPPPRLVPRGHLCCFLCWEYYAGFGLKNLIIWLQLQILLFYH